MPPPVTSPGYTINAPMAMTWGSGNAFNTIYPPCPMLYIGASHIQPYVISAERFLATGKVSLELYGNSANMQVNVSATPGDMGGTPGPVSPFLNALSGKDGLTLVANNNPNSDKRLPVFPSGNIYINVRVPGPLPAQITALLWTPF